MANSVVIGAGYGDEGKGLVTDFLCSKAPGSTEVVRFSGGHQCAHRVVRGDVDHIFSNFGSGSLLGCPTYWSKYCTFEPVGFMRERSLLVSKGVEPIVSVHPDCPVTTPYDILANQNGPEREHGTTGVGFFRTKKRHFQDGLELTAEDVLRAPMSYVLEKLREIWRYHGKAEDLAAAELFYDACCVIRRCVSMSSQPVRTRLVFEGSQGLMLDENIGTRPHCTPSDVTPRNAMKMALIDEVWLVSRVYQTRHGNGPMTNGNLPVPFVDGYYESNECNEFQGEFRTSILDIDPLVRAKAKGIDEVIAPGTRINLVITCADQVDSFRITKGGVVLTLDSAADLARFVGGELGIGGNIYINTSPRSDTITEVANGIARE